MARLLQRLGLFSARFRYAVLGVWLVLLVGAGVAAATLSGPTSTTFAIPGTESSDALSVLNEEFPQLDANAAQARLVLVAPQGQEITQPENAAKVMDAVAKLQEVPGVAQASNPLDPAQPLVSPDLSVAVVQINMDESTGEVSQESQEGLLHAAEEVRANGLDAKLAGNALLEVPSLFGPSEAIGVGVAFVVLLLTYGSLVAAGANLLTALVGVGIGAAGITALTGFVDLQSTTPILAIMLGLAVGIDYALFIFARFRSELRDGRDVETAIGRASGTAGSAVVVAGLTVVIALTGLTVVGIPFLGQMGLAAAATVVIAVLVALTLVPAILRMIGRRALPRGQRLSVGEEIVDKPGFLSGWAQLVTRFAPVVAVVAIAGLAALAVPVAQMHTSLPNDGHAAPQTQERQAYDLMAEKFGAGSNGPLLLLLEASDGTDAQEFMAQAMQTLEEVKAVDGVSTAVGPLPSEDQLMAVITTIPTTDPTDEATTELVNRLRDADFPTSVKVTGSTAVEIDVNTKINDALPIYLTIVVCLALVLLLLVFRSILVPLLATAGFLLSYGAALGATVAVFQWGWFASLFGVSAPGPIMSLLPIVVVGILFGLAMDYQVFLVSRIHEAYSHGDAAKAAIRHGFRRSAPVVIAAATIMAAVFGGFIFSEDEIIKPIAFALTLGVILDAFVVRMLLVPAVLSMLGKAAWWLPKWLNRILPNIDVEGHGLSEAPAKEPSLASS